LRQLASDLFDWTMVAGLFGLQALVATGSLAALIR